MQFKTYFTFFVALFYLTLHSKTGNLVIAQYPNDYLEFDNSINNEVNPYYTPRGRQYDEPDQSREEVATVSIEKTIQ